MDRVITEKLHTWFHPGGLQTFDPWNEPLRKQGMWHIIQTLGGVRCMGRGGKKSVQLRLSLHRHRQTQIWLQIITGTSSNRNIQCILHLPFSDWYVPWFEAALIVYLRRPIRLVLEDSILGTRCYRKCTLGLSLHRPTQTHTNSWRNKFHTTHQIAKVGWVRSQERGRTKTVHCRLHV